MSKPDALVEIYALSHPVTGEVRYIGKANDAKKRLQSHLRDAGRRDTPVYRWIRKLQASGLLPVITVVERTTDWPTAERRVIAVSRARGDRLLNVADGGDQPHCPMVVRKANGAKVAAERRACVVTGTTHEFIRRVGVVVKHFRETDAPEMAAKLSQALQRIRKMDRETLFWRIFETPMLHQCLPKHVRQDAAAFATSRQGVA